MFNKTTTFSIDKDDIEVLDGELLKTASISLPDGVHYDPDFLYMKVRAVSAGEFYGDNKNNDFFPEAELKPAYKTFLTAHTFKNHENKDIKNAIGDVIEAEWDDKMKTVKLVIRIDQKIAPTIVRGYKKGFMTDVSMGCRISHSICSICGNKARTKQEYCSHIRLERGKIMEDGRKVYEINIGPKFHDISAVLNGAERCAKVASIYISGDKVAFIKGEEDMEKVASFQEEIATTKLEKVAYTQPDIIDLDMNLDNERMDKVAMMNKIAEIKKIIQGKLTGIAGNEIIKDKEPEIEKTIRLLRLLYTKYWDKDKCSEIANQIKEIAKDKMVPVENIFNQFLKVVDFAGIELTPLEIKEIFSALTGHADDVSCESDEHVEDIKDEDALSVMDSLDKETCSHSMGGKINIPTMFNTVTGKILPHQDRIKSIIPEMSSPKIKAIIIATKQSTPALGSDIGFSDIMDRIVRPEMPGRSMHRRFLVDRLGSIDRHPENINHFKLRDDGLMGAISSLLYSMYQDDRVNRYNNGELGLGFRKFAFDIDGASMDSMLNELAIEKQASGKKSGIGTREAVLIGVPLTYTYSALQRARMNNGENINSLNRYVAENPGNAALVQLALAPAISKSTYRKAKAVKDKAKGIKSVDNFLKQTYASVDDTEIEKIAGKMYNVDIFKDSNIDLAMIKEGYTQKQVDNIKQACVLTAMTRADLADDILSNSGLCEDDLGNYLKTATDYIRMGIEKTAERQEAKELARGVAGDIIFNPLGVSSVASLPGNFIDSLVFSKLFNSKKKDNKAAQNNLNNEETNERMVQGQ